MEDGLENILAVDCGSVFTKVAFIERAEGVFRFRRQVTVPSSFGAPHFDISYAIKDALKLLAEQSGKVFLSDKDIPNFKKNRYDDGINAMISVVSTPEPLRVLLAGAMSKLSMTIAQRAVATAFAKVVHQIALDDENNRAEARIARVHKTQADVLLLVGGTDAGASTALIDLAQVLAMAIRMMPASMRPMVLFAGNVKLRVQLASIFGRMTDFKPIDNILPVLGKENFANVQSELNILYRQMKLKNLAGIKTLTQWSANAPTPAANSFVNTIHYLGQKNKLTLLGVDVGSAAITFAATRNQIQRHLIRPDLGMRDALPPVFAAEDLSAMMRWLPFEIPMDDLRNALANRHIFPQSSPKSYRDLMIDMALLRFLLRKILRQTQSFWHEAPADCDAGCLAWDMLIGAGQSLVKLPNSALALLVLLDVFQPVGVSVLALDSHGLLPMLGALASVEPLAAAQVAHHDSYSKLGTVIAPFGGGRVGKKAVTLRLLDVETGESETHEIAFGNLEILPDTGGRIFDAEIKFAGKLRLHSSGKSAKKLSMRVEGGELGIVVDARGRPLVMADDDAAHRNQLRQWLTKIGIEENNMQWDDLNA